MHECALFSSVYANRVRERERVNTAVAKTVHVNGSEFFISTILLHCHRGCRLHTHLMQFNECKRRKYVGASYILDKREIEREKKYCWRDFVHFILCMQHFDETVHRTLHRIVPLVEQPKLIWSEHPTADCLSFAAAIAAIVAAAVAKMHQTILIDITIALFHRGIIPFSIVHRIFILFYYWSHRLQ